MPDSPKTKIGATMHASQSQFFGAGLVLDEKRTRFMSVIDYKAAKSNLDKKETDIDMARRKRQNEIVNKTQTVKDAQARLEEKLEHLHSQGEVEAEEVFRTVVEKRNEIAKRNKRTAVNQKEVVEYN
jgi:hypothetical protein